MKSVLLALFLTISAFSAVSGTGSDPNDPSDGGADFDGDGFQEVYWKTNDGNVYLRSLMHADGNIRYANYQSEEQMSNYLTNNGYESVISEII